MTEFTYDVGAFKQNLLLVLAWLGYGVSAGWKRRGGGGGAYLDQVAVCLYAKGKLTVFFLACSYTRSRAVA